MIMTISPKTRRARAGALFSLGRALPIGAWGLGLGLGLSPASAGPAAAPVPALVAGQPDAGKTQHTALLNAADEITREVARLRGLPAKTPFQRGVLSRTEIGQKLRERLAKDYSKDEVRIESGVLKRLGLLPDGADYEKLLFDLLTEQVAGFYDPYARTLYIADWLPLDMQRPALAHEIQHALQDQHFDLKQFSQPLKEDGDRQLARSTLVEGDGTAVMLEFSARSMGLDVSKMPEMVARLGKQMMEMSMGTTPAFQKAPPVLRETLVFPYAVGLEFISALRQGAQAQAAPSAPSSSGQAQQKLLPWSRIDEVFRSPPESTEQVMHPEKYFQREAPVRVTAAPITTLAPRKEVRRDVLGEMTFKLLFGVRSSVDTASTAAAGWGGDRLVAYASADAAQSGELPVVVALSTWDSDRDTDEAEIAARRLILHLIGQKDGSPPSIAGQGRPSSFVRDSGDLSFAALRRGRLLLLLCGVPRGSAQTVAEEVFRTWKVEKPEKADPAAPAAPASTPR